MASLHPRSRAAFSLVELLVALSLLGVLLAVAGLLLGGAQRVTDIITRETPHTAETFARVLQYDLDRLLRAPLPVDTPGLTLDPEKGMSFPALLPDSDGILRHHRVAYLWDDAEAIRRVQESFSPPQAVTNVVLQAVQRRAITLRHEQEWQPVWPPETDSTLPSLLRLEVEVTGEEPLLRDLVIPAAFRVKPEPTPVPSHMTF